MKVGLLFLAMLGGTVTFGATAMPTSDEALAEFCAQKKNPAVVITCSDPVLIELRRHFLSVYREHLEYSDKHHFLGRKEQTFQFLQTFEAPPTTCLNSCIGDRWKQRLNYVQRSLAEMKKEVDDAATKQKEGLAKIITDSNQQMERRDSLRLKAEAEARASTSPRTVTTQSTSVPALAGSRWSCIQKDISFNMNGTLLTDAPMQLGQNSPATARIEGRFEQRGSRLVIQNEHQWLLNPTAIQRDSFPDIIDFRFISIEEYEITSDRSGRISMTKLRRNFNGKERAVDKTPVERCSLVA